MESWSKLAPDEVLSEFTPQEAATLKNIQSSNDFLPDIVGRVTDQIRQAYASGGRALGEDGIPDSLKARAVDICRWRLLVSYPQLQKLQTKERQKAHDDALTFLNQIAQREIKGAGSAQIVCQPPRRATRKQLEGLL
jgi:hypothetical protein